MTRGLIIRLALLLMLLGAPFVIGLLFTYEIIDINWISFMEIQQSFQPQENPLPLPAGSVPVDGANVAVGLDPVNPVTGDEASVQRGQELFRINCALCHGPEGQGNGSFAAFLQNKPSNLTEGNAVEISDGEIYRVISDGIEGRMPALRENLRLQDRWDVVNFVRSLQGQ
jgi:mono/diheme cytochrome c family protein